MATITSAATGNASAGATWVGGVVPGTTFAGTRTTTGAAVSIGATSIPITSGSPAVTAGKMIRIAGDPNFYRVATGVGSGSSGNIIIDMPLEVAIPASATTISVDLVDDKVIIAAGHTVTLDGTFCWGDDTSSTTIANNAVVVNGTGTLKASRSVSSKLTLRGTLIQQPGGIFDFGAEGDRIPSGVTFELRANCSGTMVTGKHMVGAWTSTDVQFKAGGVAKKRNTTLTAGTSGGATTIYVADATGWEVGDRLVIATDTTDVTRAQITTIQAGYTPGSTTVPVAAITNARLSGCRVGNLSSNVVFRPYSPSFAASVGLVGAVSGATQYVCDVKHVRFHNMGQGNGWQSTGQLVQFYGGITLTPNSATAQAVVSDCAFEHDTSTSATIAACFASLSYQRSVLRDSAIYMPHVASTGFYGGNNSRVQLENVNVYRAFSPLSIGFGGGVVDGTCENSYLASTASACYNNAGAITLRNVTIVGSSVLSKLQGSGFIFENCDMQVSSTLHTIANAAAILVAEYRNCTFSSAALTTSLATGTIPSQFAVDKMIAVNGTANDNRVRSYWQETVTDTSTRNRSTYSVKIKPNVAGTAITYTFTIPAVSGVAQTIKPALRWDTNYVGSGLTKPVLTLSGQGVTQSFTPSGSSVDTWYDTTLTYTPTSTGDITVTVTVQSTATTGFVWLDGLYHYPMTQSVRHFGYQFLPQSALVLDDTISRVGSPDLPDEAAALALPVVIDHGSPIGIRVTGNCTSREIYEACMADLCKTENQSVAVHITPLLGGDSFSTTYNVTVEAGVTVTGGFTTSGVVTLEGYVGSPAEMGDVDGVYIDATGTHVKIKAPNIIEGSRVQLYDVGGSSELLNTVLDTPGLSYWIVWTTDKTIRLRADHETKAALQVNGLLSSSGLTFLDYQDDDDVYTDNGIDGASVTEFAADEPNVQIDLNDPDGVTTWQRLYAWFQYYQTTSAGIASGMFGALTAQDALNYLIDQSLADIKFDNVSGSPVVISGGYGRRADGSTLIAAASDSIQMDPGRAYIPNGSTGATAAQVWAYSTRTLTADPGASAHATTQAAIAALPAPLDAAGTRAAVGLAAANLDTQLAALPTDVDVQTAAAAALTAYDPPTAAELASVQSALVAEHDATQSAIAALPAAPSAATIRAEMDANSTKLANLDATVSSRLAASGYAAPPAAATVAGAVRTELATELGRIDAAVSTRLAAASYTAPLDAAGTRSAVGLAAANLDTQLAALPTDADVQAAAAAALTAYDAATGSDVSGLPAPLDAAGTRAALGLATANLDAQLDALPTAAEVSAAVEAAILNELDGQAVLDAIVTAIGNQNVNEVALVAAIRADLERAGGKLDGVPAAVMASVIETGFPLDRMLRIIAAATAGKVTGGPSSPVFRNVSDTVDQVSGTADTSGNRSSVTYGA